MIEKTEEICERQQNKGVVVDAISKRYEEKERDHWCYYGTTVALFLLVTAGTTVALFLLVTAVAVPSVNASNNNCVDVDCLKEKLKRICKEGTPPPYLDCENILKCIDAGEQEIMRECARGYLLLLHLLNETETCNSQDLLYRSWCEYTRGAIPK